MAKVQYIESKLYSGFLMTTENADPQQVIGVREKGKGSRYNEWFKKPKSSDQHIFIELKSDGPELVLAIPEGSDPKDGTVVKLERYSGKENQLWLLGNDGSIAPKRNHNYSLSLEDRSTDGKIILVKKQYSLNFSLPQQWSFIDA
ncbi:uncharacterized protein LOC144876186 [Branchiostoma floridae x Branchiostoma japonicum]